MSKLADKLLERAIVVIRSKDWDQSAAILADALKFDPELIEAWILRGNVLKAQGRHFDALLHYDRALVIDENRFDAWNNRGQVFAEMGMYDGAEQSFRRSLEIKPSWEQHFGLGSMFCTQMKLDAAETEYRKAIEYNNTADFHFNLGITLLGQGKWKEGFQEYAYRWRDTVNLPHARSMLPTWNGEDLTGKSILLYSEQGHGDEILSLMFAKKSLLGADKIYIQVRPQVKSLAGTVEDVDWVGTLHEPFPKNIDYSCALLDIPMVLGLEPATLPTGRYLRAPYSRHVEYWAEKIAQLPQRRLNVGLCWQSGHHLETTREMQRIKSLHVSMLKEFRQPHVNLISLQKPSMPVPDSLDLHDWMDEVDDFGDTAALIENLDLVITVDTGISHVAGALGVETWNFVRYSGYWPWIASDKVPQGPQHSILYPQNMVLFRQPKIGDWETPVTQAAEKLRLRGAE